MSGCYVPCLPNPDPTSFLTLLGFIGIMFFTCWIIWCLQLHFKPSMTYQLDSSFYHHQSYQSIITKQSLPDYLLDTFCSHLDFCLLSHLLQYFDSHQSPSSFPSAIAHLNFFQSSSIILHHILECTSHTPNDTILVYDHGAFSGLTLFKSDFSDYV